MKTRILGMIAFALLLLLPALAGRAGIAGQVEIEMALEKRIASLVSRLDPAAIVRVNVAFKKISAPLPGTGIELKDFGGGGGGDLNGAEVAGVNVTIYSARESGLPEWLQAEINKSVPEVRAKIEVKPLDADVRKAWTAANGGADPAQLANALGDAFGKQGRAPSSLDISQDMSVRLAFALGIVGILLIALASGVAYGLTRKQMYETNRIVESRLIPALQNLSASASEGGNGSANKPTVLQATLTAPAGGFANSGSGGGGGGNGNSSLDVGSLGIESLEALFSDCYWCQRDGYAAWLWSAMTPVQRQALYQSDKVESTYLKAIQVIEKQREDDHLDPVYLNPSKIVHLSQEDVGRWVEAFLPGFHTLSPMRQFTLPLSLKTRLACMAEPLDDGIKIPAYPARPSPKRVLLAVQRIGDLTADDETTVLHNPAFVPEMLRAQLRSLVWLALKPFEARQKVLAEYTAEELATAWQASPEVLARLTEALPDKKRSMLEGYLKSIEVNRRAHVFNKLVEAGLAGNKPEVSAATPLKHAA